jgi:hypothetical protein
MVHCKVHAPSIQARQLATSLCPCSHSRATRIKHERGKERERERERERKRERGRDITTGGEKQRQGKRERGRKG